MAGQFAKSQKLQGYIESLERYTVAMQVYLNLNQQQERQLFTDYNTERKEAHTGLIMQYDQRDAYIELTREVAERLEDKLDIETKRGRLTNHNSTVTSTVNFDAQPLDYVQIPQSHPKQWQSCHIGPTMTSCTA